MKRLQENPNGKLRTVGSMAEETNMNRKTVMEIAEAASAICRYGTRLVRIDAERFYAYLKKEAI